VLGLPNGARWQRLWCGQRADVEMWCGHSSHWRFVPELQLVRADVPHLPRHVQPDVTRQGLRVHRLRVPLEDAGPFTGKARMLPGEMWGHPGPPLMIR
jgi:hypothetical protein